MKTTWLLSALFNIVLVSTSMGQNTDYSKGIQSIVQEYFDRGEFTGTVLIANKRGILHQGAYGYADRETGRKLTIETPFYLASVSKQFTSSAALMLVSEGKLDIDAPVTKYMESLPSFCNQITSRNLLNHTSGLPDYYNVIEVTPEFTNDDVLEFIKGLGEPVFEPGTQFAYSNTAYVLMSSIIQKISDQDFSSFLNERVFGPLEMKNSYVLDNKSIEFPGKAVGYSKTGEIVDYNFRTTGGGGIYSTVYDMYLWDRALYNGKQVSKYLLETQAYKPSKLANGKELPYGLGWYIDMDDQNIVYHGGSLVGFRSTFYRNTKKKQLIVLLSNNGCEKLDSIRKEISDLIN